MGTVSKFFLIIVLCFLICSCAGSYNPSQNTDIPVENVNKSEQSFFDIICNTPESNENLYFYGFSPVHADLKKEEKQIIEIASDSVMFFRFIDGKYASIINTSGMTFDFSRKLFIETDDLTREDILEILKLFYNSRNSSVSFAVFEIDKRRFGYSEESYQFSSIPQSVRDREPGWISRLPESDDYIFSVGISGRYSELSQSISRADMNAIEEMIKQKSVRVTSDLSSGSTGRNGTEYSDAVIKGFYIIRRWWSPDMRNYYSLGVSEKQN